jgi:hypothetical protein
MKKICPCCKVQKQINKFSFDKSTKDGHRAYCKQCVKKKSHKHYLENKEQYRNRRKAWDEANPEKKRQFTKKWNRLNPEKRRAIVQKHRETNYEKELQRVRIYLKKLRDTPTGALNNNFGSSMSKALAGNKNGRKWESLVGYTLKDLMKHLKRQFTEGMSWNNYGKGGWEIDHKIPKSVFNYEKPEDEDFKKCWALKNLQPMWAKDNIIKSNNLDKHFQPNLIFNGNSR